ncbi:hypothetical protein JI749_00825 [Devosia oryziradicis]|uniref:Uncharacterized protein n=1 Tax=Devosia oryziradicis TaxID=2801335 RepID=A0ABX7C2I1_9HYPH|nr:hypothetical protein [Devosia oryziradicis]QQR36221.1 hypothetical protein JI749_00825 [Devosia oryziradicis]
MKKRILYIVYEQGNFQLGRLLAEQGRATGEFDVVLWSPYALPAGRQFKEEALLAHSVYVEEYTLDGGLADIHGTLSSWLSGKPERLPVSESGLGWRWSAWKAQRSARDMLGKVDEMERQAILRSADRNLRRIAFCEDWLVRLGVDAVVFPEDNVERDSFAWLAAARRRAIRTVVSTYGALSPTEAENAYKHSGSHAVAEPYLALFRRYLPKWLAEDPDYAITRLPWREVLGRELIGETPFNPWLVNTGRSDVIALESRAMEESYLALGFKPESLKAAGHPLHDKLAAGRDRKTERRTILAERHGLDPNKPLLVSAVPPDQFSTRSSEFASFADLAAAFYRVPANTVDVNVVVSPHPSLSETQIAAMEAAGAHVERTSVAELLPLADLYLASVSSTIKWALALGIPVIDFDCYRYGYGDYRDLQQVLSVSSMAELQEALALWQDPGARERLTVAARDGASLWGIIDGSAMERLVALCLN